jgi:hypothetical protein
VLKSAKFNVNERQKVMSLLTRRSLSLVRKYNLDARTVELVADAKLLIIRYKQQQEELRRYEEEVKRREQGKFPIAEVVVDSR